MSNRANKISVLVVDDHVMVRRGLRHLLATCPDMYVAGEAEDGPSALRAAGRLSPDVILLDIRLPGANGFEVAARLRQTAPAARIIMLTTYDDDEFLGKAFGAGAHAYLLKSSSDETVAEAIRAVWRGERLVTPSLMGKVLNQFEALSKAKERAESHLGEEETQILRLLASGATNKQIARELYLSERTVKRRVRDILKKLDAPTRAQAITEATKRGLI